MTKTSQRRDGLICLCLTMAIAVVYAPVSRFAFVSFDDELYITENPHVRGGWTPGNVVWAFTTNYAANWHPLTWLSHMLDWQLWGFNASGPHLVNMLFHIANTLLLFWVLRQITDAPWRSALVAALFALHPLHVESVAWVAERKDVLSAFFWMLTLWAYVRYVEQFSTGGSQVRLFYALTVLLFTLGLMAKPMVVTLPFVLLLLDYWPLGRTRWAKPAPTLVSGSATGKNVQVAPSQLVKEKLPLVALAAATCVATCWAQHGAVVTLERVPLKIRIANAMFSYVGYLGKTFWPTRLAVFYPLDPNLSLATAMVAGVGLAGVTAVVIWRAQRAPLVARSPRDEPWLATGWFWFLGTLVPVIGLVQVGSQSMADRYTYIPSVGLLLMLCWSVENHVRERKIWRVTACVAAATAVAVCAVLTRIQIDCWRDSETLFRHALNVTHGNWVAHDSLGLALQRTGRIREAIGQFEEALRLKPDYAKAHCNLGLALLRTGREQEAIGHYEQALRTRPDLAEAHNNLGIALARLRRGPEAIGHFEQAVRLKPDYAEAHNNLGAALAQSGKSQEAIEQFVLALQITPDNAQAHCNLGIALERAGNLEDAITHYEQALRLNPYYPEAQNRLTRLRAALMSTK